MKKLLTFLTLLTLFFGVGWAEEATFAFGTIYSSVSNSQTIDGSSISPSTGSGVTVTFNTNTGQSAPTYYNTGKAVRVYTNNTIVISAGSNTISNITFTCNSDNYATILKNGTYSSGTASVSGSVVTLSGVNSSSVTVTNTGNQTRINTIVVTYSSGGSQSNVGAPSIAFDAFTAGKTTSTVTITPGENATSTSYKIGDGTYQTYNNSIEIDLTEVDSPITVYAKSSDGTNESSEVSATFTVPALGLSISPASYTGYAAQTVTLTPSNYVGDYLISYTLNGGTAQDYTEPFELSTPGTYEIVATVLDSRAGGTEVSKTATITINEAEGVNLPFVETFNGFGSTGGNGDDGFSTAGTTAISVSDDESDKSDNSGWEYVKVYPANKCVKIGTSTVGAGSATTPTIKGLTIGDTYTMTFKAAPWGTDGTELNLSASGATLSESSVTMVQGEWTEFTVTFTATATTATITFAPYKRCFLDEVNIAAPLPEGDYYLVGDFNNWTQQDPNYKFTANADGNFILNGVTIADNSKFKIMKGSAWCGGGTSDGQYNVTSDWHTDMNITVGDAGKDYFMASGGTCYFTISDRFLLTVQKAPVVIRGSYDNWENNTEMTATDAGWTISGLVLADGDEFQFIDGWEVYHGGNGAWIKEDYLGTALDMGTSGNYVVKVPGTYTISVNRWLNKMTADVERNTHNITCVANPNGGGSVSATVNGSTATSAKYLDKVTINASADNGYTLSGVVVTGATSGNEITVTDNVFTMPDEDVTITATFVAGGYAITVVSPNGTTTCPATATVGQTVSFTVAPNEGYTVNTVTASFVNSNGGTTAVDVTENNGTYSFGMPPFPVTVTVTYTKQSSGGDGEWTLVTDASQLVEGNEYIIVVQNLKNGNNYLGSYALTTEVTQNYLKATNDIELGENYLTAIPGESVAIFTLEGSEDNWMFKNGENYLYNFNTSKNYLGLGTPENGEGVFSITIGSNNVASIVENEDSRSLYCLPNVSSGVANPYFSLYKNAQTNGVHLYCRTTSGVAKPVITPGSMRMTEEFDATITCATEGATIYYTLDGTTPTTNSDVYNGPIHIERPTVTLSAIAVLDGEQSTVATAVYSGVWVYNLAEYNALAKGTENILFKNPVIVQYHYISSTGKSYIYVKDDSGCAYFHQPADGETINQLANGDIIAGGFTGNKVADEMVSDEESNFAMFTDLENFAPNGDKGLADPEHETVARIADATTGVALNNHYITIKKVKLSALYKPEDVTYGNALYFDIDNEAHIGYNKFNIDWSVVDDLDDYYNITGIQTAYNNVMEFHPTEIVKWEESVVTLRQLCDEGVTTAGENEYTISNNLMCVFAKDNSIWVKDDTGQSIWPATPTDGDLNFEVYAEAAEGIPANTRLNQAYYDQSNWCEIKLADGVDASQFEGQIIKGGSIHGNFTDKLNPTLENVTLTSAAISSEGDYAPNYYMPANFTGRQQCTNGSHSTDFEAYYFFMTPKPQEYAQIVWAVWNKKEEKFIMSTSDNDNGHRFEGEFSIDLSLNTGVKATSEIQPGYGYNFTAIIKKTESKDAGYMVYPLDLDEGVDPATAIESVVAGNGEVKSVKYVNVAGMVSDVPFQGVNIVVTEYTDGSRTTTKMLKK